MSRLTTFIAVPLPDSIKQQIATLQNQLKKKNLPISWANPHRAHITLVFLGKIHQSRVEAAAKAVEKTVESFPSFELGIGDIDYFQREKRTRQPVAHLEVYDPEKNLKRLYKILFANLSAESFSPPERLLAHITLGRFKKQRRKQEQQKILSEVAKHELKISEKFTVDTIGVYESIQAGEEAEKHHLLKSFGLKKL